MEGQLPTASDMDELLAFLPRLYAPGFKPVVQWRGGKQPDGSTQFPWPEYNEEVVEFFEKAAQPAWADYDYALKMDDASMTEAQDTIKMASLSELRTMLTYCVRGERFGDGHWEAMIEGGVIRSILERLQELRAEVPSRRGLPNRRHLHHRSGTADR